MRHLSALCCAVLLATACSAGSDPADAPGAAAAVAGPSAGGVAAEGQAPAPTRAPAATADPSPSPSPSPTPVIGPFDAEVALAFARRLADEVGVRRAGTEGDARAQVLIADAFRGAGWTLVAQRVALPQGGATQNLIAFQGATLPPGPFVVVGGHHDTVAGTPGANDNASGVGVLVAVARELADETPAVPVVLIAFGAEELQPSTPQRHHVGSEAHAEAFGDRVVAAMIVDMVGNGVPTCICWLHEGPRTLADRLSTLADQEGLGDRFRVQSRGDISDHGPYATRGIPAAFLWSGKDGHYHSPSDTSEHLRVADLERAGQLTLAFVRSLRPADVEGLQPEP